MMNKGYWQRQAGGANEVTLLRIRRKKLHLAMATESTFYCCCEIQNSINETSS
jgi:hypothetical protein